MTDKKHIKLLLIEDEQVQAYFIMNILKDDPYIDPHFYHTETLAQSLEILNKTDFDIIISDLNLSDSDGVNTIKAVMSSSKAVPPVVVVSAIGDESVALESIEAGADDYMIKENINRNNFSRCVRYALERRRNADLIKKSERFLRSVLDSLKSNIAILDNSGNIIEVNKAWNRFAVENGGVEEFCSIGVNYFEKSRDDEEGVKFIEGIQSVLSGIIGYFSMEYPCHSPEENRWFKGTVTPLVIDDERKVVVAHENITERKNIEDILNANYSILRMAGETAGFGGWSVDIDQNKIVWSDTVAGIHGKPAGYSPAFEEAIGFFAPEWHEKIRKSFERCLNDGIPFDEEVQILTSEGIRVWARVAGEAIKDDKGKTIKIQGSFQDITRQKKTEKKLADTLENLENIIEKRTADLEASNNELESFSYTVSHDLRAPLRHINGFLELLKREVGDSFSEKAKHYIDVISGSAVKMGKLIEALLSFSRLGRTEISPKKIDLNTLLDQILSELSDEIAESSVIIEKSSLPEINGDSELMKIVFTNLILNALKFTAGVDKPLIKIGSKKLKNEYLIHIEDNGAGFDMEYAGKIFGVFQRLHPDSQFEGTGIGLATVKRIIQKHKGSIVAEGEPGKGACFYFTLNAE